MMVNNFFITRKAIVIQEIFSARTGKNRKTLLLLQEKEGRGSGGMITVIYRHNYPSVPKYDCRPVKI